MRNEEDIGNGESEWRSINRNYGMEIGNWGLGNGKLKIIESIVVSTEKKLFQPQIIQRFLKFLLRGKIK